MPRELLAPPTPPSGISAKRFIAYQDFLDLDGEDAHVEWVNGRVVPMSPVSKSHEDVAGFLKALMRVLAEHNDSGQVLGEPFQMKTGPDLPGRAPDVLFVAKKHLRRLKKNYLEGPGDLVIEVISAGSRAVDRGEKYFEYEQGGVPEYWIIDPLRQHAEFYRRGKDGIYHLQAVGRDDIYRSAALPGLWLKVEWLWQRPLPPILDVLREWRLI